ncbi:M16 family metallopeptidase [Thiocapsa marina]|uniref:Peptidase M16 domain protein n=1 Tax=Thiocapsa marina 5811 TaxID=768671 RepID=F9UCK3_9GAMM|nr:pitrilysin family protein [Thiocapsa marina]EGV18116.1 peptidase M16 domain protein [Thiocapsa marina 5811]
MCTDHHRYTLWSSALVLFGALGSVGTLQAAPEIQTWHTANGARVLFVASPELPMVDVNLAFDAGSARDGERSGLASMTAEMLTQGAGDWDADAIAARIEDVGAKLGAGADRDKTSVSLRTLTRQPAMDTAVETLATLVSAPTFADADLERERRNRLIALRQDEESPRTVGQKALYRKIFGSHPYAADPSGTTESVTAITRDDLIDFHRRHYTAANAVVAIVGALDRPQAEALAERITAGLPKGERMGPLPDVAELDAAITEQIDFPSSQTTVVAGQPGMRRGDPDYFTLYVGNHILGGSGLVSLLMEEIREKRGLSYSTYSYFLPLAQPGPFLMGLQTKNDQADQARGVMLDTLRRFIESGPSEAELTAAKKNITGGFPLRIASNSDIVGYLAVIGFYDLPLDYLDRFTGRIEAVTAEQIKDAFSRRLHPDRLAIVTVGGGTEQTARVGGEG